MSRSFLILLATLAFSFVMLEPAVAQTRTDEQAPVSLTEDEVRNLVKMLSSESFADRQRATTDLLKVGPESVALLESLESTAVGETKIRLQGILTRRRRELFDDQLDAFLKKPSTEIAVRLPQWERFKTLCGDETDSLNIFGEILASERRLFAERLFASRDLSPLLASRTEELAKECNGESGAEFPVASFAAVMLLGSESQTRLIRATSTNISSALDDPRFSQLISDGIHAETLRAIAETWIMRAGIAADRPLLFSMRHNLAAGRIVALRIIKSKSVRPDMMYALLCLAKFNRAEDLPLIESLFDNETILWPPRGQIVRILRPGQPPVNTNYKVQTRDVALVAAARIRGIFPDIGVAARTSETTHFAIDSIGFSSDEARDTAFTAYRRLTGSF